MFTAALAALLGAGCNEPARVNGNVDTVSPDGEVPAAHDAGTPPVSDAGSDGGAEAPATIGPLTMTMPWEEQNIDLFGVAGHRFWIDVDDRQLVLINNAPSEDNGGGGPIIDKDIGPGGGGDIYTPGGEVEATFANHVVVQDSKTGSIADYGKMEVKLVGQYSRRQWGPTTIPNLHIDTDEFAKRKIGGFEHFRLNNAIIGTIFRELVAYRIYRALGYPAVHTSYAFLGSNVWGDDTWVPMVLVEVYKKSFCENSADLLGGTCTNMWEFPGDAAQQEPPAYGCQISECDDQKLSDLRSAVAAAPRGPGFGDALKGVVDWPMFHKYQCLSWILATPDDPIHASNNNLIMEREDGLLVWAPYSVDISQGLDDWSDISLYGQSTLTMGCQTDPECWADTIDTCEELIDAYQKLGPEKVVDEARKTLEDLDMMRPGDDERAKKLHDWHVTRKGELTAKLDLYRETLDEHGCFPPQEWCEAFGYCTDSKDCPHCDEASPYYCAVNSQCMASLTACAAECSGGTVYCEVWKSCINVGQQCGDIIKD